MREISVNKFRSKLRESVERVINEHEPMRVTRRNGEDFVVIGAEDWERNEETLYILQNSSLMEQIFRSLKTHKIGKGYRPTPDELYEINRV